MKSKFIIFAVIVLGMTLAGCTGSAPEGQPQAQTSNLVQAPLSTQSIANAIQKEGPVVVLFFWFPGGAPCQAQEGILNQVKADLGDAIEIVHISTTVAADADAWNQYSFLVRGPPTTVIVTDAGLITDRFMGVASKETLTTAIMKARSN